VTPRGAGGAGALFPPHVLREYALIADGERGALIGPREDIAWLCVPTWHDGAVFSVLLGGPGVYALAPTDDRFTWGGYYEHGTLIWRSRWVTTSGIVECREALAFPGDPHTAVLLRRVLAVDGDAQVRVGLDVAADFGAHPMQQIDHEGGARTLRAGSLQLRWSGAPTAHHRSGRLEAVLDVSAGEHHDLVLELGDRPLPDTVPDPVRLWERTEHAWARAVPQFDGSLADRDARHAYAVLRGLTSASGGMGGAGGAPRPDAGALRPP
jgi:hypothetical protein